MAVVSKETDYANWLFRKLGYETMEDWYKITSRTIKENCGSRLLGKYKGSPQQFLKAAYPDYKWIPWKFEGGAPNGLWNDIENHKEFAEWLFKKLGYETMEDWYKITQEAIRNNHGCGLLHKYNNSPQLFLEAVYPDYEWIPWKFETGVPRYYWDDIENHKKFAEWLFKELGYETMEDWYKITTSHIHNNGGQGLLLSKYKDSAQLFLEAVYPEYKWVPWKFETGVPRHLWDDIENHKEFAEWLFKELGYETMEDWYRISQKTIKQNYGSGLLHKYNSSPQQFLKAVYPEYEWDMSKFKKNYSQGQIEWLEYLKVSIPDIRHALNHINGEYSIPNSRYSADGYSEIEILIAEFHGDFWHGNLQIYDQQDINPVTKTTFGELYENTQKKKQFCLDNGYKYLSIWESEWLRGKNAVRIIKQKWRR